MGIPSSWAIQKKYYCCLNHEGRSPVVCNSQHSTTTLLLWKGTLQTAFKMPSAGVFIVTIIVFVAIQNIYCVDRSKFRTCGDTGFCRRYRGKSGPPSGKHVSQCLFGCSESFPHWIKRIASMSLMLNLSKHRMEILRER